MKKLKRTELVSFKAVVVETKVYENGTTKLYHATLDSLPKQPKRQAQLFSMEPMLEAGDIHVVTFSKRIGKSKRQVKAKSEAEIQEQHLRAAHAFKAAMEQYEKSDLIN